MDQRFIVTRQGKQFCLYAGLLDGAHRQGLKRISTTLVQVPAEDNDYTAGHERQQRHSGKQGRTGKPTCLPAAAAVAAQCKLGQSGRRLWQPAPPLQEDVWHENRT